jgi:D-aminopeptidase
MKTGEKNTITDVPGVLAGHKTLIVDDDVRTGVTAILPHGENIFQNKVPAAIYIANGFGKLAGYSQVEELGNIETPIILVNTLSVPTAADALIDYTLSFDENKNIRSVNPVVGETNDGSLNNIQSRYLNKEHVLEAIKNASTAQTAEGNVGAGTGTICFGYKGGIGSASRILPDEKGGYTVGVLVQTNFGGDLTIAGIPVSRELKMRSKNLSGDGSVMIIVATDAPIKSRNLKRLAKRALFGIARTGGNCSNGSGEYVIAFSTAEKLRSTYEADDNFFESGTELRNDRLTPLFEAVIEAVEEAVINSLFAAETITGKNNLTIEALPIDRTIDILKSYNIIK